jgi:hypothetical protein
LPGKLTMKKATPNKMASKPVTDEANLFDGQENHE